MMTKNIPHTSELTCVNDDMSRKETKMKKIIIALFVVLWTLIIGYGVYDTISHNLLQFTGRIVNVNGNMVSVEVITENDLHHGHVYERENCSKDKFIATKKDIGRPVIIFLDDPKTPDQVKDDRFTGFLAY